MKAHLVVETTLSPWVVPAREIVLRGGERVWLRPVSPDDERLILANFSKVTPEEIHQRFFEYLRVPPQDLIELLTHCDACRELALVATPLAGQGEADEAYGVVRLVADPLLTEAEFAIIVRHDWQGRGLGWAMTQVALDEARRRGLRLVFALTLRDNHGMLRMLREFGFSVANDPSAIGVVRAELPLPPVGADGPGDYLSGI